MWEDGRTAPLLSKASNRCPGCARAAAYEAMTMLRQDAQENGAPGHVLTLTSRKPVTSAAEYRRACEFFWRAFRRRYGHVEYCGFVEWTTGEAPRSGGQRRLHSHWLVKGAEGLHGVVEVQAWASEQWRNLTGAWVVEFAELRTVGGVVGYLALHHEKISQAPPKGWTGRRLRPSAGYFARSGRERRERARLWLWEHRQRRGQSDDGGLLELWSRPAPRVVKGRQEWEKQGDGLVPAEPGHFATLPAVRAADLRRGVAMRRRGDGFQGGGGSMFPRQADVPDKRDTEEARLVRCSECGSGDGRHLRVCSRASGAAGPPSTGKAG